MLTTVENRERPALSVPQIAVLDFDRTLGNIEACMYRFYAVAGDLGVNLEPIKTSRLETESRGGSFDPYSLIDNDLLEEFDRRFLSAEEPPIFYDDVNPFLAELQQDNIPHLVVTYGVNPDWQKLKIAASGFKGNVVIIGHEDKGTEINSWRNPENQFALTDGDQRKILGRSVCLIDDKAKAFKSLPSGCSGFWLQREDAKPQKGEIILPPDVKIIHSLSELTVAGKLLKLK